MGIPYYYTHLLKTYKNIIKKYNSTDTCILFLDCNSIIYNVYNKCSNEKEIIESVCREIDMLIETFNSEFTFIAFDGVPPFAKIIQQRNRRYKSFITKKILGMNSGWNTCAITPGTKFMNDLSLFLSNKYYDERKYNLSTSLQEGEGEHKIFAYIRENYKDLCFKKIIIYGLDADLIMLSLYHMKYVSNLMLYRETPEFIKQINITLDKDENYLLDISELKKTLEQLYDIDMKTYIFLCFLLGNDFMPHFPSLNIRTDGIQKILETYSKHKIKLLTDELNPRICWNNFRKFISHLSNVEHSKFDLYSKSTCQNLKKYGSLEEALNNIPQIDKRLEYAINPNNSDWKHKYYKILFDIDIISEPNKIHQICMNYVEGLEWTFRYYIGDETDWSWSYKYNYPPLLVDLLQHIPFYDINFISKKNSDFTGEMLLCYVLPSDSLHLISNRIQNQLPKNWYPDDCEIVWAYCKYFWEAHVILPKINLEKLKYIVGSC